MPVSDNLSTFADVERAFRIALANPDGAFQPIGGADPDAARRAAIRWRQRAYKFRELLRKQIRSAFADLPDRADLVGTTPYDELTLRVVPGGVQLDRAAFILGEPVGANGLTPEAAPSVPAIDLDLETKGDF